MVMVYTVMIYIVMAHVPCRSHKAYVVMACVVMVYIVMIYIVMANVPCRSPKAYVVLASVVMAYIVMVYIVMAYIVMIYIVMANVPCRSPKAIGIDYTNDDGTPFSVSLNGVDFTPPQNYTYYGTNVNLELTFANVSEAYLLNESVVSDLQVIMAL